MEACDDTIHAAAVPAHRSVDGPSCRALVTVKDVGASENDSDFFSSGSEDSEDEMPPPPLPLSLPLEPTSPGSSRLDAEPTNTPTPHDTPPPETYSWTPHGIVSATPSAREVVDPSLATETKDHLGAWTARSPARMPAHVMEPEVHPRYDHPQASTTTTTTTTTTTPHDDNDNDNDDTTQNERIVWISTTRMQLRAHPAVGTALDALFPTVMHVSRAVFCRVVRTVVATLFPPPTRPRDTTRWHERQGIVQGAPYARTTFLHALATSEWKRLRQFQHEPFLTRRSVLTLLFDLFDTVCVSHRPMDLAALIHATTALLKPYTLKQWSTAPPLEHVKSVLPVRDDQWVTQCKRHVSRGNASTLPARAHAVVAVGSAPYPLMAADRIKVMRAKWHAMAQAVQGAPVLHEPRRLDFGEALILHDAMHGAIEDEKRGNSAEEDDERHLLRRTNTFDPLVRWAMRHVVKHRRVVEALKKMRPKRRVRTSVAPLVETRPSTTGTFLTEPLAGGGALTHSTSTALVRRRPRPATVAVVRRRSRPRPATVAVARRRRRRRSATLSLSRPTQSTWTKSKSRIKSALVRTRIKRPLLQRRHEHPGTRPTRRRVRSAPGTVSRRVRAARASASSKGPSLWQRLSNPTKRLRLRGPHTSPTIPLKHGGGGSPKDAATVAHRSPLAPIAVSRVYESPEMSKARRRRLHAKRAERRMHVWQGVVAKGKAHTAQKSVLQTKVFDASVAFSF